MNAPPPGIKPMQDGFKVTDRALVSQICDKMVALHDPRLPLFRAAADGVIALLAFDLPEARWNPAELPISKPVVALIADDPEPDRPSVGPQAWVCGRGAKYWGRGAIIHGGVGKSEHYREAVFGAIAVGRFVFVETSSRHAAAWRDFLHGQMATLLMKPEEGQHHPVIPKREQMQ